MTRLPLRRLALMGASLALAATMSSCGSDDTSAKDGPDLVSASQGDISLSDGFAYTTTPMNMESGSSDASTGDMDMGDDGSTSSDDSMGDDSMADMGMVTGAFGTLTNNGDTDDALVAAACDVAGMVQIHETVDNGDGGGTMQPVDEIAIPAGDTVKLEPGGYHVMLMGLTKELKAGDTVTITLTFKSGTEITADFPVINREDRP
ncbi:MAG: copper chaperone PCu(A)C [Nocardioidaceae bacterium]|nr:copper chaperone PCu(A)C [Nocardioidaceae bacterium]